MAKKIVFTKGKVANLPRQNFTNGPSDSVRIGTWCKVLKRYSVDHTVDVETAEGFHVTRVPVSSREWVTVEDPILGERNLPPVGAIVFMLMPTGGIDNAFILTSCFIPSFDKHTEEFLKKGKEDEELTKKEGNWKRTFDKVTGDLEVVGTDDDDKTLTIIIKKSENKIQITDWNENGVIIDENGVMETIIKKRSIEASDDIDIKSKKGSMSFKTDSTMLIEIGNQINTLGKMVSKFMDDVAKHKTVGAPAQHVVSPNDITTFQADKAEWDKVFK